MTWLPSALGRRCAGAGFGGWAAACCTALALLSGCATAPPPKAEPAAETGLEQAVQLALADLTQQAATTLASAPKPPRVLASPTTETFAGAALQDSALIQTLLRQAVQAQQPRFVLAPADTRDDATDVDWRLESRLFAEPSAAPNRYTLELRLLKPGTNQVLAQSSARVAQEGLRLRTVTAGPPAKPAEPAPPVAAAPTPAQVAHAAAQMELAQAAYAAGRLADALARYGQVAALPGADVLKARVGEYVTLNRLGRKPAADAVFEHIVALGLKARALTVKLLFAPRGTDFWPDPAVSGPYAGWLKEIARQAVGITDCLAVVGHSSRSGGEVARVKTSLDRARMVGARLINEAPTLAPKLRYLGMGSKEAVVGTGADDASDAVDRRVEFRVVPCN